MIPDERDDKWTGGDPDKASEIYGIPIFRYGSLLIGFMDILRSTDDGETWRNIKTIEDRNPGASSTPAVTFVGDEALLTYNTQPYALSKRELYSVRLKIIPIDWFRAE